MMNYKDKLLGSVFSERNSLLEHQVRQQAISASVTAQPSFKVLSSNPPLKDGERGLVLPDGFQVTGPESVTVSNNPIDPVMIRKWILLWDRLDLPRNPAIGTGLEPDLQFLHSEGVLQRTFVGFSGTVTTGSQLDHFQAEAFRHLDQNNPAAWSLSEIEGFQSFGASDLKKDTGLLIEIYNAIPIPDGQTPLNEILEFKLKRRSELLELRWHLDAVYQKILASPDTNLGKLVEMEKLNQALSNLSTSSNEFRTIQFNPGSLSCGFSVSRAATVGATSFSSGAGVLPAFAAGVVAGVNVNLSKGLSRKRNQETPFRYLESIHKARI